MQSFKFMHTGQEKKSVIEKQKIKCNNIMKRCKNA